MPELHNNYFDDNEYVLVQGVRRHQAGNYTCIGSNLEGDQESNTVRLRILCELQLRTRAIIYKLAAGRK